MKPQRYAIIGASIAIFGMLSACSTLSTDATLFQVDNGVYPSSWQHTGVPISQIASWIHHGFTASQAIQWRTKYTPGGHALGSFFYTREELARKGYSGPQVAKLMRGVTMLITAARAANWRDAGFSPSEAFAWNTALGRFAPQQAALWRRYGFSAKSAGPWNHFHFSPQTAQAWEKAGVDNANEASAWESEVVGHDGITQSQVLKTATAWCALWKGTPTSRMYLSAATLMHDGASPNTVKPYITHGLSMDHSREILDAQSLVRHGLSLSKAVYYGKHDVRYSHIAQYNHELKLQAAQHRRALAVAQREMKLQAAQLQRFAMRLKVHLITDIATCIYNAARDDGYGVSFSYALFLAKQSPQLLGYAGAFGNSGFSPEQQIAAHCGYSVALQAMEAEVKRQNQFGHCNEACRWRIAETIKP